MAQAEDTELRDLVIEALEKNGSLAKIRALLRANIFLAFEDDCDNVRQNVNLDNILKLPEGIVSLSIVHEFLEFCNLKNTLFVYKSESRQGKDYSYDGQRKLNEKLNLDKQDVKEPILITLIKSYNQKKHLELDDRIYNKLAKRSVINYKDDENCTYIVHEDSQSSTTSNSQSDNSSDEKNKLHLRLQLDNSDTDTSSDSAREKTSSEYIPSEHIIRNENKNGDKIASQLSDVQDNLKNENDLNIQMKQEQPITSYNVHDKKVTNSSSDSTSYVELVPYNALDAKLLNTAGVPLNQIDKFPSPVAPTPNIQSEKQSKIDSGKSVTLSSISSLSLKDRGKNIDKTCEKKSLQESGRSDADTTEYSFDFTSSLLSRPKDAPDKQVKTELVRDRDKNSDKKNSSIESQQSSQSSQSSISISDVADLISEKSSSFGQQTKNDKSAEKAKVTSSKNSKKKSDSNQSKILSDDSGDFTESPVPSLSNLSLDIHSD